jgi:hypothetical protein
MHQKLPPEISELLLVLHTFLEQKDRRDEQEPAVRAAFAKAHQIRPELFETPEESGTTPVMEEYMRVILGARYDGPAAS